MIKNIYSIVGVMSGTSLDGIDLVYAEFQLKDRWNFKILAAETVNYSENWRRRLKKLVSLPIQQLEAIDDDYTEFLSGVINQFLFKNSIQHIDAVCSHGHTALHQPDKKVTYQIGNKPKLAQLLEQTVVCDFRVQDVELGGQGAPLVPIGDKLLFSEYDFCLNLGGFANISTESAGQRIAYDICPVNIVLNKHVNHLGFDFDQDGQIAASGTVHEDLLKKLNNLHFYKEVPPKSLGLEWVDANVYPLINTFEINTKDVLRTFVEHIAVQVASEVNKKNKANVFITGGGAYNNFLIERLKHNTNHTILIPSNDIVEFKEALIFGFLGVLKLRDEVNCLQSVTGASKNHSSGKIYHP
ncbi:anhydro-N-acetylmuramic acid kinase [Snuella sedimenti]|uniref:Anhydro-N-acetylmuramic acid kinase n=1 Tax=Snuella sedimenti TaxID=2798802 RepID=A0A8J7J6C4_9FLAO|nr:anhydro-N-acetylmuramic acid kinase [Snuella sedimenti]MBJ6369773.1 anhydro-N-acetylmuramic acid kinase [Snuella sedimenti]